MKPFKIRNIEIDPPLILSPMAGVTDFTFRRLIKRRGGVGLVVSEFISVEGLTRHNPKSKRQMRFDEEERPFAVQIFGGQAPRMALGAEMAQEVASLYPETEHELVVGMKDSAELRHIQDVVFRTRGRNFRVLCGLEYHLVAALLTSIYSWRLIFMTFFGKFRGSHEADHHVHESPWTMLLPLLLLAVGSASVGWLINVPHIVEPVF
jgi:hypothetical protein